MTTGIIIALVFAGATLPFTIAALIMSSLGDYPPGLRHPPGSHAEARANYYAEDLVTYQLTEADLYAAYHLDHRTQAPQIAPVKLGTFIECSEELAADWPPLQP